MHLRVNMETIEVKKIIAEITDHICKQLWMDFEITQYSKNKLIVAGIIDPSSPIHNIEICFEYVFFISLPLEWKTDTSSCILELLEGENAYLINRQFQVEQGYHIFKFTPEDYPNTFGCLIGAKRIAYKKQ